MSEHSIIGNSYIVDRAGEQHADGEDVCIVSALADGRVRIDIGNMPKGGENTVVEFALDDFMRVLGRALIGAEE